MRKSDNETRVALDQEATKHALLTLQQHAQEIGDKDPFRSLPEAGTDYKGHRWPPQ